MAKGIVMIVLVTAAAAQQDEKTHSVRIREALQTVVGCVIVLISCAIFHRQRLKKEYV